MIPETGLLFGSPRRSKITFFELDQLILNNIKHEDIYDSLFISIIDMLYSLENVI